jgi:putative hemolysin
VTEALYDTLYKKAVSLLPTVGLPCGRFTVKLANSVTEVEEVQRLRFRIFNEELGEGIPENAASGLDRDSFDEHCDHLLLVLDKKIVATFRLLFGPKRPAKGFYTESEFSIAKLPIDFNKTVELGRGCIDPVHRKQTTLLTLFWGLHCYMEYRSARYLMGCGSLFVKTNDDAEATYKALEDMGKVIKIDGVGPLPGNAFTGNAANGTKDIPQLLNLYLEFGAKIYSKAAYDPIFRCYDLLMMFDMQNLSEWGVDLLTRFDKRLVG